MVQPKGCCLTWYRDGTSVLVGCQGGQAAVVNAHGQLQSSLKVPPSVVCMVLGVGVGCC